MAHYSVSNLLSALPKHLSSGLFADARIIQLKPRQRLFSAGDVGEGCYRLENGLLSVMVTSPHGEERIVAILGSGAIVGELSMIDGRPRSASVIAIRQSTLRYVSRDAFARWSSNHSEIYQELVGALAARLREADEAMAAASFLSGKGRVARALLGLAEHVGDKDSKGRIVLNHRLNQSDLAAMAGATREQVNRVLSDWRRRGLVSLASHHYCIEDPAALKREVDSYER